MADQLDDVRVGDLTTFLHVAETKNVTAAARQLNVTISQVSKAIARLEKRLGRRLLERTSRGVYLTEDGARLLPRVKEIRRGLRELTEQTHPTDVAVDLTAPSFLAVTVGAHIATRTPGVRFRLTELGPSQIRAAWSERAFDMALLPGEDRAPAGWNVHKVGSYDGGLFANPTLAKKLGGQPIESGALRRHPFIQPIQSTAQGLSPTSDGCPVPPSERIVGVEVQTFLAGLEVAAQMDQVVFGPALTAQRLLDVGALVRVHVRGWQSRTPVQLLVADTVLARVERRVIEVAKASLDAYLASAEAKRPAGP